jgi:hypothetical protein
MTRGTITNKTTGQTLTGEVKDWSKYQTIFTFVIDGTGTYIDPTFRKRDWDFTEERKPLVDQIKELPVGTLFWLGKYPEYRYVKISSSELAFFINTEYNMTQSVINVGENNDNDGRRVIALDWSEFND